MHATTLLAGALSALSILSTAAAIPLTPRQYGPSSKSSFSEPFNIIIRPVNLGTGSTYLEPIYLSKLSDDKTQAVGMHSLDVTPATFTLNKGTLSTVFSAKEKQSTWSNSTPEQGQLLTFTKSKASALSEDKEAASSKSDDVPEIRIGGLGSALLLLSVDDDAYAFYFCSSQDGKIQYGLSMGKRPGKDVKCVNVYAEAVPAEGI